MVVVLFLKRMIVKFLKLCLAIDMIRYFFATIPLLLLIGIHMYKYFTDKELECKHCEADGIDPVFMQKVDKLRGELGFAFPITSAYRCPDHP